MMRNVNDAPPRRKILVNVLAGLLALGATQVCAQSTGATIRGQVATGQAQITATNTATGFSRSMNSSDNGHYSLAGLPPGNYRIEVTAGGQTSSRDVTVQVGQTLTLNLGADTATTLDAVQVMGSAILAETRTSEVATYITQKQIDALPQGTRNFLAFADSVPGMQFVEAPNGNTSLRGGTQNVSAINVYIDGVGQKGYTLPGGVGGQDSTRGNPFPQSAIGEYKVITSNYKAEFDQISSAAIVATTRSGSNEFTGNVFYDRTSTGWRARTPAELLPNSSKVESKEEQYGASFGGPIIRDALHFFVAYEAKEYSSPRTITLGSESRYDLNDIPLELREQIGSAASPFEQDMYFGKLVWTPDDRNLFELSAQLRKEDEITGVGGQNTVQRASVNHNEVNRYDLRWQYSGDVWLNDVHLNHEELSWNPHANVDGNGYILNISNPVANDRQTIGTILNTGATSNNQDKGQKGWSIQNDLTFSGWERHTLKMGVKYKAVDVNAVERHFANPQFYYDLATGLAQPYRVEFATGNAGTSQGFTSSSNKQFGIYIQDDWEVNDHLTLNLGLRWDYETTPNYEDFVTPKALADALRNFPNFQNADWNPDDYISTGSNRHAFKDAWQPRLGFSYDLNADQRHVIFGGAGRSYDRNLFDSLQLEDNRTSYGRYNFYFTDADGLCRRPANDCVAWNPDYLNPGVLAQLAATVDLPREYYLNNNRLKTPYSDQYSLGMRNLFGLFGHTWHSDVTLSYVHSRNGITTRLGNRRPDGTFHPPGASWGAPWGFNPPTTGNIILIDNSFETKNTSLLFKLDKPFTAASGWGTTLAYTYANGKQNNNTDGSIFSFDYADVSGYGWLRPQGVPEHRLVATGIWDAGWGVTLSGKLTLESPRWRNALNCLPGGDDCFYDPYTPDGTLGYRRFDLSASKFIPLGGRMAARVRADVLNVFNWFNWTDYDNWYGFNGTPNANFGNRSGNNIIGGTRMLKLSFALDW